LAKTTLAPRKGFLSENPSVLRFLGLLALFTIIISALAEGFGVGVISTSFLKVLGMTLCLCLIAVAMDVVWGYCGILSLGHFAFFGLGGYAMGVLAWHAQMFTPMSLFGLELAGTKSMPVIWLVAIVAGAGLSALIGFLSLRSSGVYFIMLTLAFGQMVYYFAISWPAYGGEDG
jgi:ABC-type branched-subunit amino acid transport system permease subunit